MSWTKRERVYFWVAFVLVVAPFLYCYLFDKTFAPLDGFNSLIAPYTEFARGFPKSHFWIDTVALFWPRYAILSRHEFPISFVTNGGFPLYADTVSGFFSPFGLLTFGLFPATHTTLNTFWLLQYLTYFLGLWFWLRKEGVEVAATFCVSVTQVFTTALFVGSYLAFQSLGALCFLPWSLWALKKYQGTSTEFWLPQIFLALSVLNGNMQTSLYPLCAFGLWTLIHRRWRFFLYSGFVVVLLTLPMWWTGLEYHVLQNPINIDQRQSEVPKSFFSKFLVIFAFPAVVFPGLFGSSSHLDFLKVLDTSTTYFIGSIGALAPLLILSVRFREFRQNKIALFGLSLICFSVFVMLTPLVKFFYYRVLCMTCLGLSLSAASLYDRIDSKKLLKLLCVVISGLIVAASSVAFIKHFSGGQLKATFSAMLKTGTYRWWTAYHDHRIETWFSDYLSDWSFFLQLYILLAAAFIIWKKKNKKVLLLLIVLDCIGLWANQIVINPAATPNHLSIETIKKIQRKSPAYPFSRFLDINCGFAAFPYHFVTNEFQGANGTYYYGSTTIPGISVLAPKFHCEYSTKKVTIYTSEQMIIGGFDVIAMGSGWTQSDSRFMKIEEGKDYSLWTWKEPSYLGSGLIWDDSDKTNIKSVRVETTQWDHWGFSTKISSPSELKRWHFSMPDYPGWSYFLDKKQIYPKSFQVKIPEFEETITKGEHTFEAKFSPRTLIWGGYGMLFGILILVAFSALKVLRRLIQLP